MNISQRNKALQSNVGWDERISAYEYEFLKSYLYGVYTHTVASNELDIIRCVSHSPPDYRPLLPSTIDAGSLRRRIVGDSVFDTTLKYEDGMYDIVVTKERLPDQSYAYMVYSLGHSVKSSNPKGLVRYLLRESVGSSYYRSQVLRLTPTGFNDDDLEVRIVEIKGKPWADIFLSDECRDAVKLFIETLNNYSTLNKSLSYLLSGKPGTGKTETIRAIIESCRTQATVLLVEGQCKLPEVFDFASFFSPAVVCLDDIDLICGSRVRNMDGRRLGEFLSLMDGFRSSNVFVLATTNDKIWVDLAASRPGRFDIVLDFDNLDPSLYLQLITQRCQREKIIELFTDQVLQVLQEKKVSGAFVMNVIKHLELHDSLYQTPDTTYVLDTISRMYRGFYKWSNANDKIGFTS